MKLAEINNCYKCPHCYGNEKAGGICLLISENIGMFTDVNNQILYNCPLPDASELLKLRKKVKELESEVQDLEFWLNNPEL